VTASQFFGFLGFGRDDGGVLEMDRSDGYTVW
jgi:hypothetical protein